MPNATYYVQECPTCGRNLEIRVEHLGRIVVCQHCRGSLMAADQEHSKRMSDRTAGSLLRRAEELLQQAAQKNLQAIVK